MPKNIDYPELAAGLLEQASVYDHDHWNDAIDDGGFGRCEVLRKWTEAVLRTKITDESALSLNRHTAHPGESEVEDLARHLPHVLEYPPKTSRQYSRAKI